MNHQHILAAALIAKKLPQRTLEPGKYPVRGTATIALDGLICQAPPQSYRPTTSLPLKAVLGLALQKAGIQAKNISKIIIEAATEALAGGDQVETAIAVTEDAIDQVERTLEQLPLKERKGAMTIDGVAELITLGPIRISSYLDVPVELRGAA